MTKQDQDFLNSLDAVMETDPISLPDPTDRAILVFSRWHVDEAIGPAEAQLYAQRLLQRLRDSNLRIELAEDDPPSVPPTVLIETTTQGKLYQATVLPEGSPESLGASPAEAIGEVIRSLDLANTFDQPVHLKLRYSHSS